MCPTIFLRSLSDDNTLAKKVVVPAVVHRPINLRLNVAFIAHQTEHEVDP
jgi:hypothetical protein